MKIALTESNIFDKSAQEQIAALFDQLGSGKTPLQLDDILHEKNNLTLAYCEEGHKVIGVALLCTYQVLSGSKGWIEDVVVDAQARRRGIGRKLMEALLEQAKKKKLSEVLLFSADHRQQAISLYKSLGFQRRDTNLFILKNRPV